MTKFLMHLKTHTKYVASDKKLSSMMIAKNKKRSLKVVLENDSKMEQRLKRFAQLSAQRKKKDEQKTRRAQETKSWMLQSLYMYPLVYLPIQKPFDLGMAICRSCFSSFLQHPDLLMRLSHTHTQHKLSCCIVRWHFSYTVACYTSCFCFL